MAFHKNLITVSIFAVLNPAAFANTDVTNCTTGKNDFGLQAHPLVQTAADFAVADHVN